MKFTIIRFEGYHPQYYNECYYVTKEDFCGNNITQQTIKNKTISLSLLSELSQSSLLNSGEIGMSFNIDVIEACST